jgi:hypothetical protein
MEQKVNIEFCFKTGKTATEIFQLLKKRLMVTMLSLSLSRTWVYEWYARFRDGSENLENYERSGRQQPFEHVT